MLEQSPEMSLADKVADLKGTVIAVEALLCLVVESLPDVPRQELLAKFGAQCAAMRDALKATAAAPQVAEALERHAAIIVEQYS